MTDREILSNALDKAIANGYVLLPMQGSIDHLDIPLYAYHFYGIIFSHSFTKAFFGTKFVEMTDKDMCCDDPYCSVWWEGAAWEWHLMQMVKKENPIKYLEKFL